MKSKQIPSDSEINKYKGMADSYCINVNCHKWELTDRFGCKVYGVNNESECSTFIKHIGSESNSHKEQTLKERILNKEASIRKLEDDIKNKRKELQELYDECYHKYEVVTRDDGKDIIISNIWT